MEDASILCATFDIQQVMYLPMSRESSIFYKRRLSNYNLIFYNISNKDCHCYLWDEAQSKRGPSEISTSVHTALKFYDSKGIEKAYLFADGCSGQIKISFTPSMMLYTVINSKNLEISLRSFETNHGQSEGDSAHSTIGHALNNAGDLSVPSQIFPVVSLARPKQPYIVNSMHFDDFPDFKTLSKELRILEARRASDTEESFAWGRVMKLQVTKSKPDEILYKTSHFDTSFKTLSLKRLPKSVQEHSVQTLNPGMDNVQKKSTMTWFHFVLVRHLSLN